MIVFVLFDSTANYFCLAEQNIVYFTFTDFDPFGYTDL